MHYDLNLVNAAKSAVKGGKNLALRRLDGSRLRPIELVLEVINSCNSRCLHCNIWRKTPTRDLLTPGEIQRVLSDPLFKGLEAVLVTGGEPTLRHDLKELVEAIREALPRASIFVSTNGLLPDRLLGMIKEVSHLDLKLAVGTSLDGIGARHDETRGVRGNFENVEYLIRRLQEEGINMSVGFVLSDYTVRNFDDVTGYLKSRGVECIVQWYDRNEFYGNEGTPKLSGKIHDAVQTLPDSMHKKMWLDLLNGKPMNFSCFAMCTFCFLRCDGYLTPCLRFGHVKTVNIREMSPSEIWKSKEAGKMRKMVKNCSGCLNNWGVWLSMRSAYIPLLVYKIGTKMEAILWK